MDGDTTFGAWLKSRRRQLDLTQKGLAHLVGCSVGTIRKMEADERRPSRQLAGLLAEYLEIPIDQHEVFIAFARSEPYISDTPLPVLPNSEDQIPIIPPKKKKQKIKHNLPLDVTQFVGRETELNALDALFKDQEKRLVTILGPGGIGKTRLALDYARHQLDEKDDGAPHPFKDGVFFVDLTPLQETERLVLHLAEALNLRIQVGAQDEQSPKQQLLDYLRDRQLFLLLDNYEHLLPALVSPDSQGSLDGAALVSEILGIASGVSILVTSRVRLNLQMEQVFAIEGLSYPEISVQALEMGDEDVAGYTAIQLFLQAAQRSRQDFSLETADERRALLQICQLVGGMPLGLELAAAWVDVLSLSDIAAEIQQCFDFLETELRDVPPRHRSMRATFDNSWRKLNEREQAIFTQLSVFRGGFTRQAAQVVTDATLRQLSRLANKSFIQFNQPRNRYQVHELLRQYGTERLEQESELLLALLDLHSKYYCQVLADYTDDLKGAGQPQALVMIEADIANVRQAWSYAIQCQDLGSINSSIEALRRFYWNIGWLIQGINEFEKAIIALRIGEDTAERGITLGRLLTSQSRFYGWVGQPEETRRVAVEGLSLLQRYGAREEQSTALLFLADFQESIEKSNRLAREGLALATEFNDQWAIGHALMNLSDNALKVGDYAEAQKLRLKALKQFQHNGDVGGTAWALYWLSIIAVDRGRYQKALSLARETMSISREINFPIMGPRSMGIALYTLGEYEEAESQFQFGLTLLREMGLRDWTRIEQFYLGKIAYKREDFNRAENLLLESLAGALAFDGHELAALNYDILARIQMVQNNSAQAKELFQAALRAARWPVSLLTCLASIAELFIGEGKQKEAALLTTFIINHPATTARVKERADQLLTRLESQLSPDELEMVRQRSQESDLDSLAAQLVIDLEAK